MTLLQLARLRLALTHGPLGLDAVQLAEIGARVGADAVVLKGGGDLLAEVERLLAAR